MDILAAIVVTNWPLNHRYCWPSKGSIKLSLLIPLVLNELGQGTRGSIALFQNCEGQGKVPVGPI